MKKILRVAIGIAVFVFAVGWVILWLVEDRGVGVSKNEFGAAVAGPKATGERKYGLDDLIKHLQGKAAKIVNVKKFTWAGHTFEAGILSTKQYKTDGNKDVRFTDSGFYAPSYAMPRSKLFDVNMNQKTKVKIMGIFKGRMDSSNAGCTGHCITTEKYHFSEFAIYIGDESGNKQGLRVLGTRDNTVRGNTRSQYTFTSLTVENTAGEIVVTDSSGLAITYSSDFKFVTAFGKREPNRRGDYGTLDPNQKWFLVVNCHVNGEGYCKLDIKEVQVTKN